MRNPELLVYTRKNIDIGGTNTEWGRLYFLEEKIPDKMHNTFIKLSAEITLTNPELMERIVKEILKTFSGDSKYDSTPKWYDLHLMLDDTKPEVGKFYTRKEEDWLEYKVLNPYGQEVKGKITKEELEQDIPEPFDIDQLKPFLLKILEITSKRGHTLLEFKFHAEKSFKDDLKKCYQLAQSDYKFIPCLIGLAMNGFTDDKGKFGNLEIKYKEDKDNDLVIYKDPRDGRMRQAYKKMVCLNVHFTFADVQKKLTFNSDGQKQAYVQIITNRLKNRMKNFIQYSETLVEYYEGISEQNLLRNGFVLRNQIKTRKAYTKYLLAKAKRLRDEIRVIYDDITTLEQNLRLNSIDNILNPLLLDPDAGVNQHPLINIQIAQLKTLKGELSLQKYNQGAAALGALVKFFR